MAPPTGGHQHGSIGGDGPRTGKRIGTSMNMKRMRRGNHRSGGGGGGGGGGPIRHHSGNIPLNRNHVFDSSGPDLRIRGTAQQLFEKYLQLGRDASSSGDRVMAESYFQHAEHYFRILNAMAQAAQANAPNGAAAGGGAPGGGGEQRGNEQRGGNEPRRRQHAENRDLPEIDEDQVDPLVPASENGGGEGARAEEAAEA
jgi:hypothetical protein